MEDRNCFTFFASFFDAMRVLSPEDRLKMYDAIVEYGLFGVVPDLTGVPRALFSLMKPNIDNSNKKRDAGRAGGLAGGAPIGNQNARKNPLQQNKAETKQKQSDIEIEKEIEIEVKKESSEKVEEKGSGERGEEKRAEHEEMTDDRFNTLRNEKINQLLNWRN